MKAVLISIKPKWCKLIASGKKTVEVRKIVPKLDTPFKCYIYCTTDGFKSIFQKKPYLMHNRHVCNGMVIGEFMCDRIGQVVMTHDGLVDVHDVETSCLTVNELYEYANGKLPLYGWHISDLAIYDKPKALNNFRNPCSEYEKDDPQCGGCDYYHSMGEYPAECACDGMKPMTRPPQSWCYVVETE